MLWRYFSGERMSVATGFEPVAEVTADERAILGLTAAP
jgi:hypothetical protein